MFSATPQFVYDNAPQKNDFNKSSRFLNRSDFIVVQDIDCELKNKIKCRAYFNEPRKYAPIEYSYMQYFANLLSVTDLIHI